MLPLMLHLYVGRLKEGGAPLQPRIDSEMATISAMSMARLMAASSSSAMR